MEAAISGLIQASLGNLLGQDTPATPPAATTDWRASWFVFMAPDVSDETAAAITKAEAWPAFMAFFRLLWKRQREAQKAGREEAENACMAGILAGEGVRGLARSIGITPKAMARQLAELHRLGILAVAAPPASLDRDEKGRIVRRPAHRGLVPAARVIFNAGDQHRRPANRQGSNRPLKAGGGMVAQGSNRPLRPRSLKGRFDTTPISPRNISRAAGGHADGIGRPAAGNRRRQAGGLPSGRGVPQAAPSEARWEDQDAPIVRPWPQRDLDAFAATKRRLDAEEAAKAALEASQRRQAAEEARKAAETPPNATEAARGLQEAVAALPATSKAKARKVCRRMTREDRKIREEARRLEELVRRRREEEASQEKASAAQVSTNARAAWRGKRAKARTPAAAAG